MALSEYHEEVTEALRAVGNPEIAEAIRKDRGSQLQFLGVRAPTLRRVVKAGFSFTSEPPDEVLRIWNDIWLTSPYSDVMIAAIEYYALRARKHVDLDQWVVQKEWVYRVDNWAHADGLCSLYSRILERFTDEVYGQLQIWNQSQDEWLRRISVVSLIHYTGKNAVFLPLDRVLPMTTNCLTDERHYVQKGVGWVLREMGHVYPEEIRRYLEEHGSRMPSIAFSRAIERRTKEEKAELRAIRKKGR